MTHNEDGRLKNRKRNAKYAYLSATHLRVARHPLAMGNSRQLSDPSHSASVPSHNYIWRQKSGRM